MAGSTPKVRDWITIASEQLAGYEGQVHITCRCGWKRQAAHKHIGTQMAAAHIYQAHGVVIEASPRRPAPARAAPQQMTPWQAAGTLARTWQRR